ncbi:hypothetical protein CPB83DRAFT_850908 [Crepidotus variabilis]|uniref:Uncharacterized protein n=1 Tax=Crepidotus variabilis TaxID=179855 RepID=A0A9P6JRN2_9AGAR|nr:hypothetical protein CPB83DRAFT_850908 [Crepidotus variabilis]
MFFKVPALLLVAFGVLSGVLALPIPSETNGQRLARGLPPSPPKFLKRFLATPVSNAKRTTTSPLPPVTLSGRLQVRSKENGSSLGNVRNWPGGGTISGTSAFSPDGDLLVTLTYNPSDPTKIQILSTNPAFPAPFYVGAGTSNTISVPHLAAGDYHSVGFTNVESTAPGSPPSKAPSRDAYVESAIWTINPSTKQLTAQFINEDGSTPPTVFAYDIRNNNLFFTGDIAEYNSHASFLASAVDLYLV